MGVAGHLIRRFVTSLTARPLSASESTWVESRLVPQEWVVFRQMSTPDQRHALIVAQRLIERLPSAADRPEVVAGALLHDVGKQDAALGTFARVAATLVGPRTERFRRYHDHEEIGAEMLRRIGSAPGVVAVVARSGDLPPGVADALEWADNV